MKFAFSTVSSPKWDFETLVIRAKEYGYDGIEIRGSRDQGIQTASDIFLTDTSKVRSMFSGAGLEICCIASSIAYSQNKHERALRAAQLRDYIDTAEAVGCAWVKIFDAEAKPGVSRSMLAAEMGDWLLPLGDYAAEAGVGILVENSLSFRTSKEMWMILDRINHPAIGCCWDIFNAALLGESPSTSVPVLNSKIQYAQVKDAKFGVLGAAYCKLGEGDVQVEKFIKKMRGIGFEGYVTLEWEKAWLPNLAEPEEILPDSIAKLRRWNEKLEVSDAEAAAATK
jgi:sugar phosphate isomerase/epimerase